MIPQTLYTVTQAEIPPLVPRRSVCEDVYSNCIKHVIKSQLPWPQHLNCGTFPPYPSSHLYPPHHHQPDQPHRQHYTAQHFVFHQAIYVPTQHAGRVTSTTTTLRTLTLTSNASFMLFTCTFYQIDLFSDICLFVWFVLLFAFVILLLFHCLFCAYVWQRFRGKFKANREEMPRRESLGPLTPVSEQWH